MVYSIYKATNILNNKAYIGFTKDLEIRKKQHVAKARHGSTTHFHNALRKYGSDNFSWEIIAQSNDKEYAWLVLEEEMILKHGTYDNGYNQSTGGYGKNRVNSKDHRRKISKALKGRKQSKETIQKRVEKLKGQKRSEEFKRKISKLNSGRKHTLETRQNMSNAHKKKITIDGITYDSRKSAAEGLGVSISTIQRRLNAKIINYD